MLTNSHKTLLLSLANEYGAEYFNAEYGTKVGSQTIETIDQTQYDLCRAVATAIGVDFDATGYTFTVSKRKYVNSPSFWLIDGQLRLVWGKSDYTFEELQFAKYAVDTNTYTNAKNQTINRHSIELELLPEFYDLVGDVSVSFPIVTKSSNIDRLTLTKAIRSGDSDLMDKYVMSRKVGGNGDFAKSKALWTVFQEVFSDADIDIDWTFLINSITEQPSKFGTKYILNLTCGDYPSVSGLYHIKSDHKLLRAVDHFDELNGAIFTMKPIAWDKFNDYDYIQLQIGFVMLAKYQH